MGCVDQRNSVSAVSYYLAIKRAVITNESDLLPNQPLEPKEVASNGTEDAASVEGDEQMEENLVCFFCLFVCFVAVQVTFPP